MSAASERVTANCADDVTQKSSTIDCVGNIPTLLNPVSLFWSTNSFGDSTNVS